jgi:30S ribosomal protein 3
MHYNLNLQVLWLDDALGLAVNQKTTESILPITSYYFWPASEAWEQIRFELDSKPWIPETERVKLLNSIVDIMNRWQKSRNLSNKEVNLTNIALENVMVIGSP